jgi:hypothetical protein
MNFAALSYVPFCCFPHLFFPDLSSAFIPSAPHVLYGVAYTFGIFIFEFFTANACFRAGQRTLSQETFAC